MRAEATFPYKRGFVQLSEKRVVLTDWNNHCLRLMNSTSHSTAVFSGQCESSGYQDGLPYKFNFPYSVVLGQRDRNQLIIADRHNKTLRTLNVHWQVVGTFVKSDSLKYNGKITHDEKNPGPLHHWGQFLSGPFWVFPRTMLSTESHVFREPCC